MLACFLMGWFAGQEVYKRQHPAQTLVSTPVLSKDCETILAKRQKLRQMEVFETRTWTTPEGMKEREEYMRKHPGGSYVVNGPAGRDLEKMDLDIVMGRRAACPGE